MRDWIHLKQKPLQKVREINNITLPNLSKKSKLNLKNMIILNRRDRNFPYQIIIEG